MTCLVDYFCCLKVANCWPLILETDDCRLYLQINQTFQHKLGSDDGTSMYIVYNSLIPPIFQQLVNITVDQMKKMNLK